jgi:hypothetical protein
MFYLCLVFLVFRGGRVNLRLWLHDNYWKHGSVVPFKTTFEAFGLEVCAGFYLREARVFSVATPESFAAFHVLCLGRTTFWTVHFSHQFSFLFLFTFKRGGVSF